MEDKGLTLDLEALDRSIFASDDFTLADVVQLCALEVIVEALEVIASPVLREFLPLAQNRTSNLLQRKLVEPLDTLDQLDLYGDRTIDGIDFRLFIKGYSELVKPKDPSKPPKEGIQPTAAMLLDCLLIAATEDRLRNTLVRLPLKKYMDMRNLRDAKEARKQVKLDMGVLESVSFEYRVRKKRGEWLKVHISGGTTGQVKNGDIIFRFNQEFFDSFRMGVKLSYAYMYFPLSALQVDIRRNPHSYWLARRLAENKRINQYKPNRDPDKIGVRILINSCPYLPAYEKVMAENRNLSDRIIKPFERDMNALSAIFTWDYCNRTPPRNYGGFITAYISVRWLKYPVMAKTGVEGQEGLGGCDVQSGGADVLNGCQRCAWLPLKPVCT